MEEKFYQTLILKYHTFTSFWSAYQTVSVDGLANSIVLVSLQQKPLLHGLHEIQVLVCGHCLFSLFGRGPPLVGGALQVKFEVHLYRARQQIVHNYDANVLPCCLDTVESIKLW